MKLFLAIFGLWITGALSQNYSFPDYFKFGVATAAYQIEGAWNVSEITIIEILWKTQSIWDYHLHANPSHVVDHSNGDVACDSYHKLDEDIKNLKDLNVNFYRFSISWPRLLKNGYKNYINKDGVRYYNDLINKLLDNGIEPMVTIFHWDLPQNLEDLGGWTNRDTIKYFGEYARVCFELFGDRVKTWITLNEPTSYCQGGYIGVTAPFYISQAIGNYLCGHYILLGHAKAYHIYNDEFQEKQQGKIGLTLESSWFKPLKPDSEYDRNSAETVTQMHLGWFAHPIILGDYPPTMRQRIDRNSQYQNFTNSRLPTFTKDEIQMINGTFDFLGLNHYSPILVMAHNEISPTPSIFSDFGALLLPDLSLPPTASPIFKVEPVGLRNILKWILKEYGNNFEIIITENGYAGFKIERLEDTDRSKYYNGYLQELLKSIYEDGNNVTGYTAWSLMDNFEWGSGYTIRFGLFHVDFEDKDRPRTAKQSACVFKNIIKTRKIDETFLPSTCNLTAI